METQTEQQIWERVRQGRHTAVAGIAMVKPPPQLNLIRVSCDAPFSTMGPVHVAQRKIEHILGGTVIDQARQARQRVLTGLRQRLLGDLPGSGPEAGLVNACNRLARQAQQQYALVFDALDAAAEPTLDSLTRIIQRPGWLQMPLLLVFRQRTPAEVAKHVVEALRSVEGPEAIVTAPGPAAATDAQEAMQTVDCHALPAEVLRVLRAGAVIGGGFEADLVAALLELTPAAVYDCLQRAADQGVPVEDRGDGSFGLPKPWLSALQNSLLPSLQALWHRQLGRLLTEEDTDAKPSVPPRGAGNIEIEMDDPVDDDLDDHLDDHPDDQVHDQVHDHTADQTAAATSSGPATAEYAVAEPGAGGVLDQPSSSPAHVLNQMEATSAPESVTVDKTEPMEAQRSSETNPEETDPEGTAPEANHLDETDPEGTAAELSFADVFAISGDRAAAETERDAGLATARQNRARAAGDMAPGAGRSAVPMAAETASDSARTLASDGSERGISAGRGTGGRAEGNGGETVPNVALETPAGLESRYLPWTIGPTAVIPDADQVQGKPRLDHARAAGHLTAAGDIEAAANRYAAAASQAATAGAFGQAIEHVRRALILIERLPTTPARRCFRIRTLIMLGRIQWLAVGPNPHQAAAFTLSSALATADAALASLHRDDPAPLIAEACSLAANICYDLGDLRSLERALDELTRASRLLLDAGDATGAARLLNDQAAVYVRLGDPVRATHLLTQSQNVFERKAESDPVTMIELAETHHLFARLPLHARIRPGHEADAYSMGLDRARIAERWYRELGATRELARVWETMGRLELCRQRLERASFQLSRAMQVQSQVGDITGLARSTGAMAEVLAARGMFRNALMVLGDSIALNLDKGSPIGLAFNRRSYDTLTRGLSGEHPPEVTRALREVGERLEAAENVLGQVVLPEASLTPAGK